MSSPRMPPEEYEKLGVTPPGCSANGHKPHGPKPGSNSANSANSASRGESKNAGEDETAWVAPAAFRSFELPEFPEDVLPGWLGSYVTGVSEATQTPVDLASMLSLSAGAAAAAKVIEVEPWPGWREPANLYTASVLRSGARKTSVYRAMCAPLEEHEAQLIEEARDEVAQESTRYRIVEERLKKAQTKAAKPSATDEDTADAISIASDLAHMKIPASPKLLVDDSSPEKLASLMASQGGRINLMSAEGGVFDMMAGRYSQGIPNLDVYLKGHAGDPLRVDRVGRASDMVKSPALNMALAVQPDVLSGLADKPGFRGRGLLGRFLYSIPRDTLGSRRTRPPAVSDSQKRDYAKNMGALYSLSPKIPDAEMSPHTLKFSPLGQDVMQEFAEWLEPQLARDGQLADITDWAGKLAGAVARLSGVLHMLENPGSPLEGTIGEQTVRRAVSLGHYLLGHARYALSFMGADPDVEDARYMLGWLENRGLQCFTKRDAFEGTKGRFSSVSELEPGLEILESHGYIRQQARDEPRGRGRPPSPVYEVNPLWSAENKEEHPSHNSQYSHNSRETNM